MRQVYKKHTSQHGSGENETDRHNRLRFEKGLYKKHRSVFFINYQNKAIKKAVRQQNKLTVYGI